MTDKLTPKQEAFCQEYLKTGNASEAYRLAYDASKMKAGAIHVKASELLNSGKVTVRLKQLQNAAEERNAITIDDLINELEEARTLAMTGDRPQVSAAVSATMGKAKMLGFLVDKVEQDNTSSDGSMTPARFEFVVVDKANADQDS